MLLFVAAGVCCTGLQCFVVLQRESAVGSIQVEILKRQLAAKSAVKNQYTADF